MKIALIQYNPVIGDFGRNLASIAGWLDRAKAAGCALAMLPELAICGYPPQDLLERPAFLADHDRAFNKLVAETRGIAVLCGHVSRHTGPFGKPLHNSASLFRDGQLLFTTEKQLLPTYDVFDESRYFEPGIHSRIVVHGGLRLGVTICEDIWNDEHVFNRPLYPVDPVESLMGDPDGPPDLLVNLSASPFHLGKEPLRQRIFANICQRHLLPLIYVNQVGGQDSLVFDGGSRCLDRQGNTVALARRFQEDMVVVDTATWLGEVREAPPAQDPDAAEAFDALVLGTRDYVGKCGFAKVVLGLSGGVDSALTAAIAAEALGRDQVLGVALPSPYSSPESIEDAEQVAKALGIEFTVLPITPLFTQFRDSLHPIFGNAPPDLAEQNIQARIRGNLLMAIANKQGRLLLSTGNKSENAVGYCTLYGDMSGGLAVISDVPKQLVYAICRHLNRHGEVIPWRTIEKPPSAELAPNQRDDDDLPPYPVLDQILVAYLEENRSIAEIEAMGFDGAVVKDVVRRIRINEYKRKQAAMGLKITSKAFGYGRRYPTAQRYLEGNPL
ncbi:MAG: NAD+ synthase [Thermodesulfobacteriota bacterium]